MDPDLLNKIPIDQRRALVELIKKKEAVQKEHLIETFKPNPGAQTKFLNSSATIRALFAGNGTGKTTAMVVDMIWSHLGIHPYRDTGDVYHTWLVIPSLEKMNDYWEEIKKWCPPSQLPKTDKMGSSTIRRLKWKNGTITTIYSHEQDSDKFESTNISGAFFDEPPKRSQWVAVYRGLRANPKYFIAIAATPISAAWMYQELYLPWSLGQDKSIDIFKGSTYENKHISTKWIEDFESRLTDEEKRVRIHGDFAILQGRVYKSFSRDTHVIASQAWPRDWPIWVAIDPHSKKPHAALWVGITPDDNYVVVDEISEPGEISDLAERIKEKNNDKNIQGIIIDNSGVALDWSRTSAVNILSDHGIFTTPVRRSDKDVDSGINRVKQLLKGRKDSKTRQWVPKLKVMAHCRHLITEFEMYTWTEPKNPESTGDREQPRKVYDEYLDCLRYIVNRTPQYQDDESELSLIDQNNQPYSKE